MDKQHIVHICSAFLRRLKKYGNKAGANFDAEDIHQFRVTYKKLRAFLRMLSQQPIANGKIKIPKEIKSPYAIAGSVRDLQLQQQRIEAAAKEKIKNKHKNNVLLNQEIEKLKPLLTKTIAEINFSKSKKEILDLIPHKFTSADFIQFIQNKWTGIHAIIASGHFSDANMHRIRKSLKDLFCNLKLFKSNEYKILYRLACRGKDEKYFVELLRELGSFQEKCVAITLLITYSTKLQLKIYNQWIKEKNAMRQILIAKLKAIIVL